MSEDYADDGPEYAGDAALHGDLSRSPFEPDDPADVPPDQGDAGPAGVV